MPTPKKSETLEIRLSYPAKQAFMARCRAQGCSASETLRAYIEADVAAPARRRPAWLRLAAGAAMTLALGAVALPSVARPSPRAEFDRLDRNGDARLSLDELADRTAVKVDVRVKSGLATSSVDRAADQARLRTLVLRTVFDRLDADRSGEVSFDEYLRAAGRAAVTAGGRGGLA